MLGYDREPLQALFNGLIGSDGHMRRNQKTCTYTTTSGILLNQVAELSVKLGLRCSTSQKPRKDVLFVKAQRIIRAPHAYVAHISNNHQKRPITLYPSNLQRLPYDGTVWCLEVEENHNFLVERDGQYAFCGNSSELFGKAQEVPQRETTSFYPRSPYACAKAYAYYVTRNYREAYGLFAVNGILFNHESPRRGETFVSRKITRGTTRIKAGLQETLYLGNLDAKRDWGYAPEYVEAMWMMLQQAKPEDFVIATGETHSVQEFVEEAFGLLGLDWRKHVQIDPRYLRPTEVDLLIGDSSKAGKILNWKPKTTFKDLVRIMVTADMELASREAYAQGYSR